MARFFGFFQRLFGARIRDEDDHLLGAIDLSDSAYCFGLIAQERE